MDGRENDSKNGEAPTDGDDGENIDVGAAPDLQEALGVTPSGNCVRHPNCPVLSLAHNKIMSCRVCFSEEKSVGIRQRKSFAAVVHQLQQLSGAETSDDAAAAGSEVKDDEGRIRVKKAHSASMQALILQQPQTMDSIMKRLAQVQNWILRRKEKEVMSLQMQIQSLEEKLHDAEAKNQEQLQTIWALRRTIQQDMKIIKTMAVQKERERDSMSQHGSPMNSSTSSPSKARSNPVYVADSPSLTASPDKTQSKSGHSISASSTPMASPDGKTFSSDPNTPDQDDPTPRTMQGIILDNDPLLDKVRQKKKALQSRFEELRASNPNNKKSSSGHAPGRPLNPPSNIEGLKRSDGNSLRGLSTRSLDEMVEPISQKQQQTDITMDTTSSSHQDAVRTQYWNDEEYASLTSDPTKIFASFRGGLLDIPKSPPAASHDNRQKNRPKLQLDTDQMAQLKMPRMRGVGRTLSYQSDDLSTDGISVDGRSFDGRSFDGRSFDGRSFDGRSFDGRSYDGKSFDGRSYDGHSVGSEARDNPFHNRLGAMDSSQKYAGDDNSIHMTENGKKEHDADDCRSVSSYSSYEQPPPPPLHSNTAPPPKSSVRKPKRTVSADEILDVVPEAHNEDDDLNSSKQSFMAYALPQVLAPTKPPVAPYTQTKITKQLSTSKGHPSLQDDETVDTTPSFFTESGASAALSGQRAQEQEKEKFIFSVTGAQCQDKYGDAGMYTGTILVTEGLPHGKGCMKYESGREYDGHWVSGQWHGHGKLLNPNGDVYEGEFVLDARHGKGEYRWDNGDVYTGDFSYDRRNGNGKFCFHNGNVYEGEFVDGMFEGFGRYDFGDGYYEGEWRAGRYHGDGELQYSNGGKYTGEFRESLAHGFGVELLPDGTKRRGVWERGQPVEFFHRTNAEGVDVASRD
ncbi:hypothetical protein ACA910_004947 [Epithemia clementina (nom. ined.)]